MTNKRKNRITVGIKRCLKERMDKFYIDYEKRMAYPYEIYTLMCCVADDFDIEYTMKLHGELMGIPSDKNYEIPNKKCIGFALSKGSEETFTLQKKYYIDMGLKCYAVGRYVGFDGEYYRFEINKNHWIGSKDIEDVYKKKQKFMKHLHTMKLYQATIECVPNNCYIETVLVIAEDEELAHKQLIEKNGQWGVTYTQKLKELDIDMTKPNVIKVGFGHSESDY